jgi:hypothetical protein
VAFVESLVRDDQLWAVPYRPLIAQYGPAAVFAAGVGVLGYPPTWDDRVRFKTVEAVRSRLIHTYGT